MLPQILTTLLSNPLGLAAAVSPFVFDHINAERARLAAETAHKGSEMATANKIANDVSVTMDNLAYLSRQVMFGIVFRQLATPEDQGLWKTFQDALMKWESSKSTTTAQIEMYFGPDCGKSLKKIQQDFEILINEIDAAFFKRTTSKWFIEDKEGGKNDFRKKFLPVWDSLIAEMTELFKEMIRLIQYEEVGSLRQSDKIVRHKPLTTLL